ncbi:MAG: O-antigen ligase family protein, partial [Actinobacteria bacterium]|nr:O-antigen ligase family protein [Actinomycetota bacterium]
PLLGAAGALVLATATITRSVVVALVASLLVLVVLLPRRLRVALVVVGALAISLGAVVLVQAAGLGLRSSNVGVQVPRAVADPGFVADDGGSTMIGGVVVAGDAAEGTRSREVGLFEGLDIPALENLVPGRRYTVSFAVKPLGPELTTGIAGNNAGTGWGMARWTVRPASNWQRVYVHLTATAPTERLIVAPDSGPARVRFDVLMVTPSREAALPPSVDPGGTNSDVPDGPTRPRSPIASAALDTFDPNARAGHYANMHWRLDFWAYLLRETAKNPVLGVGFGRPAAFEWKGITYDARTDPSREFDFTPPHNSFVNVLYRMGGLGLLALGALLAVAVWRGLRLAFQVRASERAWLAALVSLLAFIVLIACFNVALEGPYMSMFFWTALALLLVLPGLHPKANDRPSLLPRRGSFASAVRRLGRG